MPEENLYRFNGDDKKMQEASEKARQSFKFFWRELSWEYRRIVPALDLAIVKVPFKVTSKQEGIPPYEHMWINNISFDGENITGFLANQPNWVDNLSPGDEVNIPLAHISDWMYASQDKVYGGYSVHAMRAAMGISEREAHDSAWGFEFGDPESINITPYSKPESKGFMSKLFGCGKRDLSALELPEHPMSENSAEGIEEYLTENPSAITDLDDDGWTMMQRESLAGNLAPVLIFLKHGADPHQKNPNGKSSIELAKQLGWKKIVDAFANQ
jgi:uncharacterized protein YegJ (DUF2314 family)